MVGQDDLPILHTANHDKGHNVTYSMQKEMKKANIQTNERQVHDNDGDSGEYIGLVDDFVKDVIAKAKIEYLGGCANGDIGIQDREGNEADRLNTGNLLLGVISNMLHPMSGLPPDCKANTLSMH